VKVAWLYALLALCNPLFSLSANQPTTPYKEQKCLIKQADLRLQNLNEKIKEFLTERTATLKESEAYLKEIGKWEQELKDDVIYREDVKKLHESFLNFRERLMKVVYENFGTCSYSRSLQSASYHTVTEWYANHLEDVVFQQNLQDAKKNCVLGDEK
jgi:hypothetical protein